VIDQQLRDFLLSFPGVSNELATRIYPGGLLPQENGLITSELPAVTMMDVSATFRHNNTSQGSFYSQVRYQLATWADTLLEARRVDGVVCAVLDGFKGTMSGCTIGGVFKQNSFPQYQSDVKLWRVLSDYMIHVVQGTEA
jgi:hypothetical protein